jgi:hypothetical protein
MATLIFTNGILEQNVPTKECFVEEELINLFKDYKKLRTKRIYEIPNCWTMWGENPKPIEENFNRLAAEVVEENVFSPILFIHDSELNPDWNVVDNTLYSDYKRFCDDVFNYVDAIAEEILSEQEEDPDKKKDLMSLKPLGYTADKRLMFGFIPSEQDPRFYEDEDYRKFAERVFEYLSKNFMPLKPFVVYADSKVVVSVEDTDIDTFMDKIIEPFSKKEEYDTCIKLRDIKNKWHGAASVKEVAKRKAKKKEKQTAVSEVEVKPKRKYVKKNKKTD